MTSDTTASSWIRPDNWVDVQPVTKKIVSKKQTKQQKQTKPTCKQQSRNWCFTDFELLDFKTLFEEYSDVIRYIGYGRETCPTTKKPHYQGWIQFVNKKQLGGVKRIMGTKKIHLESCRGSELENVTYCSKANEYKSFGSFKLQGQRTDLEDLKRILDKGGNVEEVAEVHFGNFLRYHAGIEKYKKLVDKRKTKAFRKIEVEIVCGPTGTNKTRHAVENNPDAFKITGQNLKWFDGYDMEQTLIIDEYNNDIGITKLLNILDGYQLRLDIKGSFTYANWTKVVITTNLEPHQFHSMAKDEHVNALKRRVTKWTNLYQ